MVHRLDEEHEQSADPLERVDRVLIALVADEEARQAHLSGQVASALMEKALERLSNEPRIEPDRRARRQGGRLALAPQPQ